MSVRPLLPEAPIHEIGCLFQHFQILLTVNHDLCQHIGVLRSAVFAQNKRNSLRWLVQTSYVYRPGTEPSWYEMQDIETVCYVAGSDGQQYRLIDWDMQILIHITIRISEEPFPLLSGHRIS